MINLNFEKIVQRIISAINNIAVTIESNPGSNNRYTPYGDLIVSEKTNQFSIGSVYPVSALNNRIITAGSATLTQADGEIQLNTTANGADSITIETNQSAIYLAGVFAEWSFGARFATAMTGNQVFEGGLTDFENGWMFYLDATGFGIRILKRNRTEPTASAQTTTNIPQSSWNQDRMDGTGASSLNLADFITSETGIVFLCQYTFYGYGDLDFYIRVKDGNDERRILVHKFVPSGGTITSDPNQPISIRLRNAGTATARTVFLSSRQFSLFGKPLFLARKTSISRINFTNNDSVQFPALAFRRKAFFNGRNNHINVKPLDFYVGSDNRPHRVTLFLDDAGSLTTGAWVQPPNIPTNESCLQANLSATTYTPSGNAIILYRSGVLKDTNGISQDLAVLNAQLDSLPKNKELILVIRAIGGNSNTEVCTLTVAEYF